MAVGDKYKILLIDDDKFLLDVHSRKFRDAGHEVVTAMSGVKALEILKQDSNFDAVLLDLVMPAMDGIELLEKIRGQGLAEDSALIVFSNQDQTSDIEKAKKFKIAGYIVKASAVPSEVLGEVAEIIDAFKNR